MSAPLCRLSVLSVVYFLLTFPHLSRPSAILRDQNVRAVNVNDDHTVTHGDDMTNVDDHSRPRTQPESAPHLRGGTTPPGVIPQLQQERDLRMANGGSSHSPQPSGFPELGVLPKLQRERDMSVLAQPMPSDSATLGAVPIAVPVAVPGFVTRVLPGVLPGVLTAVLPGVLPAVLPGVLPEVLSKLQQERELIRTPEPLLGGSKASPTISQRESHRLSDSATSSVLPNLEHGRDLGTVLEERGRRRRRRAVSALSANVVRETDVRTVSVLAGPVGGSSHSLTRTRRELTPQPGPRSSDSRPEGLLREPDTRTRRELTPQPGLRSLDSRPEGLSEVPDTRTMSVLPVPRGGGNCSVVTRHRRELASQPAPRTMTSGPGDPHEERDSRTTVSVSRTAGGEMAPRTCERSIEDVEDTVRDMRDEIHALKKTITKYTNGRCPIGTMKYGADCLLYVQENKTWLAARDHCLRMSASLVHVHSSIVQRHIKRFIKAQLGRSGLAKSSVYTGLIQTTSTGTEPNTFIPGSRGSHDGWYWQALGPRPFLQLRANHWAHWAKDQPHADTASNGVFKESCVVMEGSQGLRWESIRCSKERSFICHFKAVGAKGRHRHSGGGRGGKRGRMGKRQNG